VTYPTTLIYDQLFNWLSIKLHLDKPIAMIAGRFEQLSINIIVNSRQFYNDEFSFFGYFDLLFIEYANTYLFLQLLSRADWNRPTDDRIGGGVSAARPPSSGRNRYALVSR